MRSKNIGIGREFTSFSSDSLWFSRITNIISLALIMVILFAHLLIYYKKHVQPKQANAIKSTTKSPSADTAPNADNISQQKSLETSQNSTYTNNYEHASAMQTESVGTLHHYINICNGLIIVTMFCSLANSAMSLFNYFYILESALGLPKYCGYYVNIQTLFWHTTKNLIYYIFVLRIAIAFKDSIYEYPSVLINGLFILITSWFIFTIYGDMTDIYGEWIYNEHDDGYWCKTHVAVYGVYLSFVVDTILSSVCLYLFVKPLYLLLRETAAFRRNSNNRKNDLLLDCVIKYTLLTFMTISSTASFLIIAIVFSLGELALFDSVINIFLLLLMTSVYDNYYNIFCKSCHKMVYKFAKRSSSKEDAKNDIALQTV